MSIVLSPQETENYLAKSHIARIATVKPNGAPHVTPVWYLWQNNQLLISIDKNSVKTKNIKLNNKVAISIDTCTGLEKGVIVEGTAKIDELSEEIQREIYKRYVRAEDLEKYLEYTHSHYSLILLRINPEKIVTWDYSKDPFWNTVYREI